MGGCEVMRWDGTLGATKNQLNLICVYAQLG